MVWFPVWQKVPQTEPNQTSPTLLQKATREHQIQSAFTRSSIQGSIYVEGNLDAGMISLLSLTPGIIRK